MKKVIVIGTDAVNALGLVQSLGREGLYVIVLIEGKKSFLISSSKYVKEIMYYQTTDDIPKILLSNFIEKNKICVFASGDGVALVLDQNYALLQPYFLFEHAYGDYSIQQLMNKDLQVQLANRHNFLVPNSVYIKRPFIIPKDLTYPCIVKPLISCLGDKRDILIAYSEKELNDIITNQIQYSNELIIQEYIEKDYEYDIMGCSFQDNTVYMPLSDRMVKFNRNLQNTSTVSYIEPFDEDIAKELPKIKSLMMDIKYVGLFSVEFIHSKVNSKIYFTEINFRNDGENAFIVHEGVNLPYLHYQDLSQIPLKKYFPSTKSKKYIWEGIHFNALLYRDISVFEWIRDIIGVNGFLYFFKDDPKPFFKQFGLKFKGIFNKIRRLMKIV